jgi:hypothetical protein
MGMKRAALIAALAFLVAAPATASAAIATPSCTPAPTDCSGWYRVNVKLTWAFDMTVVQATRNCDWDTFEEEGIHVQPCEVQVGGQWTPSPVTIRIDKTPPAVGGAAPSRGPDANGWYRSPVQVTFFGLDPVPAPGVDNSGLVGCSAPTYAGPDTASTQVLGQCWDRAGNVSAVSGFGLRYDSTAPSLASVRTAAGDRVVRLRWSVPDAADLDVWRSPGRSGAGESKVAPGENGLEDDNVRNGRRYHYRVRAIDEAGNVAIGVYSVVPGPRLLAPAMGATADAPPLLRWTKVRGARYYNVQLVRKGRKILSAWPGRPRLQLEESWRFGGKGYRLRPGTYHWFVWPGRGPRSKNRYGPAIGRGKFKVE